MPVVSHVPASLAAHCHHAAPGLRMLSPCRDADRRVASANPAAAWAIWDRLRAGTELGEIPPGGGRGGRGEARSWAEIATNLAGRNACAVNLAGKNWFRF